MKTSPGLVLSCAFLFAVMPITQADESPSTQNPPGSPDQEKVTKLDGTNIFGFIEITDDYTIRVKSDSGIQNIPIAMLGEKDFRKYGFAKDRSKDGRLWSERKDALEEEKKDDQKKSDSSAIEIHLAELAPFQPLISAYESMKPPKAGSAEKEKTEKGDQSAGSSEKSSTMHMFSGPGSLDIPTVPFASSAAETVASPAATAASSVTGFGGVSAPPLTPP